MSKKFISSEQPTEHEPWLTAKNSELPSLSTIPEEFAPRDRDERDRQAVERHAQRQARKTEAEQKTERKKGVARKAIASVALLGAGAAGALLIGRGMDQLPVHEPTEQQQEVLEHGQPGSEAPRPVTEGLFEQSNGNSE